MFTKYALILLTSTATTALITPFFRDVALRNGLLDLPNDRKIHADAIPRLGGIAVFGSFLVAAWLGYIFFDMGPVLPPGKFSGLLSCTVIVFILGITDDIRGLSAPPKLIVQLLAAFMLNFSGFMKDASKLPLLSVVPALEGIGSFIGLGLTVLWLVGITNAMNLIDGLDGLSSGVGIFSSLTFFIVSLSSGNLFVSMISIAIFGSTLGFLWHNWHPAKIFMGDCGAMFLGFVLAAISIEVSYKSIDSATLFVPVLALGLPIIDTFYAIVRRFRCRAPLFSADREHIHHKLLHAGFSSRQAVSILYGVCVLFGAAAWATTFVNLSFAAGIAVGMFLLSVVGIKILGRVVESRRSEIEY